MATQAIDVGTTANDGTGDTVRGAFQKVNANAEERAIATTDAGATQYGSITGLVNGANTVYTLPSAYATGTLLVWYNGLIETDFTETTPASGIITMGFAPQTGLHLVVTYKEKIT